MAARPHSTRELGVVAGISQIVSGNFEAALDTIEAVGVMFPGDAMLAKLQNDICYFLGVSKRMLDYNIRALSAMTKDTPMVGYVYGMYAFTCEESGDFETVSFTLALVVTRKEFCGCFTPASRPSRLVFPLLSTFPCSSCLVFCFLCSILPA